MRPGFRLVEYLQGEQVALLKREVLGYVFDASLMLVVMVILAVVHPSEVRALLKGGGCIRRVFWVRGVDERRGDSREGAGFVMLESAGERERKERDMLDTVYSMTVQGKPGRVYR